MVGMRDLQAFLLNAVGDVREYPEPCRRIWRHWRQNEGSRICVHHDPISHRNLDLDFPREFHVTSRPIGRIMKTLSLKGEGKSLCSFVCSASW
ncbi:hypothetical protein AVEN_209787-1 [Araneus ventricosus]|uniref:Uncharacterized protein n=1 Tax=Araneus ventricosus TaxID=182803 RepID=A0A4Y2QSS9_ARAVE|nr:hypothetical protein AVEN_224041-1 [Araneus ventricosus]GBN66437.1 hypothetical protein AVEN_72361-1 [Araneus ventricosus]GBN66448.1 hypothetical protein AVEN_112818-1 [Araneus ventricosus]GBN66485.1 hypothetical protein AVEN_209787-1 [Araneus ventricosus]